MKALTEKLHKTQDLLYDSTRDFLELRFQHRANERKWMAEKDRLLRELDKMRHLQETYGDYYGTVDTCRTHSAGGGVGGGGSASGVSGQASWTGGPHPPGVSSVTSGSGSGLMHAAGHPGAAGGGSRRRGTDMLNMSLEAMAVNQKKDEEIKVKN